ncbi:Glutamate receptor 2.1 [Camellia lanceoleosa]|uniref:Glutamate receptor 2.1 n=1 Tax=Camellia lanceoleosa TaxID=1840588 RepID=A0ACC0FMC5_9ERIC|nr:Glutamate receptor 2.1 [Camellia lanceoleosa]
MAQNTTTVQVKVGVVLDMNTWVGKMGLKCISMALSDIYSHPHFKTRLDLHVRDSKNNVVALDLLKTEKVQSIIGPLTSMQANFLIHLGEEAHVSILSFSATSHSLSSLRSPYFFRAALNDSSQVQPITSIIQALGWKEVVPIYIENEYGEGLIPFLTNAFQEIQIRVPYKSTIHPSANDEEIVAELYKLMTMQTRVFIVHMTRSLSDRLFTKANEIGMMSEGYVWIITDRITNSLNFFDHSVIIDSMQGVIGVKPHVPRSKKHEDFISKWKNKLMNSDLNVFGLWAYDAAISLAMAVEKVGALNLSILNLPRNSAHFDNVGVSETVQVKVGVVLDMNTWVGKMGLKCISMALSDLYSSHPYFKTRLDLHVRDSKDNVVGAAAADVELLKTEQVKAIIGPLTSISTIHPVASDEEIVTELYKLMTMQTRVFIVHMACSLSARLFTKANEISIMSEGYVWIIIDGITNSWNFFDPSIIIDSMQRVIGVKQHVPKSEKLEDFTSRWKNKSHQEKTSSDLNVFGLWAYDPATSLAMAVEKVGALNLSISNLAKNFTTDFKSVGVPQNGIHLCQALSSTPRFRGLSGNFSFVDGQLQSSAFEIVNLIRNGPRGIGFWMPEHGIVREFKFDAVNTR